MEYQKKITDSVRKLTRLPRLRLWEGRPSVVLLAQLEDAIDRVIYMFLNPAKAGLVNTIDEYPGLNTWKYFKTCEASVDAQFTLDAYWTPASTLEPLLDHNKLSPASDRAMVLRLQEHPKTMKCELVIKPLAWLGCYGITDPVRIESIRQRIIKAVYDGEAQLAKERLENKMPVIGAERLKQQAYLKPHTPKKKERRIFVICGDNERRPSLIALFKDISRKCRECYLLLKEGKPHDWPPGTFIPWVPPKEYQAVCF
jgi:hypothetical protein